MKKNLIIILVIVAVAIAGIFVFSSKSKQGEETISPAQPAEEMTQTEEPATIEESEDKIEEPESRPSNSLSLGGSYRCTYTIENGIQVTTYVKNGKMRTEIPLEGGDTNISLYTDNKVYQWSDKEKEGVFISVEEAKNQPGTEVQDPDEYLEEIKNKYKLDCKNIDVSDSLFALPKDIEFQDLSQSLNQ